MASYKTKIARLNALLDAQAQVIQEYAKQIVELERRNQTPTSTADMHTANIDKFYAVTEPDRHFLRWIHARLQHVHGEDPLYDYMHQLRAIIAATPHEQCTPNVCSYNNLEDIPS